MVVDIDNTGVLEEIEVPVYALNGDAFEAVAGETVKVKATKITSYKVHVYVNGEYFASNSAAPTSIGYNGYIVEGYSNKYYIDGVRISQTGTAGRVDSWCVDNVRSSWYKNSHNVDLGYRDASGEPIASIKGLKHFLVMPDNMSTASANPLASVDGVEYFTEAEAIAAIKEGSVVEIFRDLESYVEANASFKLITNGDTVPGFISATHKPVDYVAGLGFYKLVPASASELYTVNYTYGGVTKYQTMAMGTTAPILEDRFPGQLNGNVALQVAYWVVNGEVSDYNLSTNEIKATPVTEEVVANFEVDGFYYDNFAEAFANATGETLVFRTDLVVDAGEAKATTYKTASATVVSGASVGINVTSFRLKAFVVSAFLAGMAGALYGLNYSSLTASKFNFNTSINILVFVVLGGMGNILGSVISATLLYVLPEAMRSLQDYRMILYAIVLIVVMLCTWSPKVKDKIAVATVSLKKLFKKEVGSNE
jgi:hypothetical protein